MREQQCPGLVLAIRLSTSDCRDDTPNAKNSSHPYTYQPHERQTRREAPHTTSRDTHGEKYSLPLPLCCVVYISCVYCVLHIP